MAKTPHSQYRGPGVIPGWGTSSHMPQLRDPACPTKTQNPICHNYNLVQPKKKKQNPSPCKKNQEYSPASEVLGVLLEFPCTRVLSMWTENFQMFKLDLEKEEEREIKLPTSVGSQKKQENSRKTSTSASLVRSLHTKAFDCMDHNKLWKILKEMGISNHIICLLRNLYVGQEATVKTGHGTTDWFKIGKRVRQGCMLSPCLFYLYEEYIMWSARLDEAQAGIKIAERNINNLIYAMTPPLWQKVERD